MMTSEPEWLVANCTDDTGTQLGLQGVRVHARSKCAGRALPCCIHNPSNHKMKDWPLNWRSDTYLMERLCQHQIGHPDPDHVAYMRSLTPNDHTVCPGPSLCEFPHYEWQAIHGCDGCCYK